MINKDKGEIIMRYLYVYNAKGKETSITMMSEISENAGNAILDDRQHVVFTNKYEYDSDEAVRADIIVDIENGRILKSRFTGVSLETAYVDEHKNTDAFSDDAKEYIVEISPFTKNIDGRVTDNHVNGLVDSFVEDVEQIIFRAIRGYVDEQLQKRGYDISSDHWYSNGVMGQGIILALQKLLEK